MRVHVARSSSMKEGRGKKSLDLRISVTFKAKRKISLFLNQNTRVLYVDGERLYGNSDRYREARFEK